MLRGILIPSKRISFFHPNFDVVRKRNHTHRLPDTEGDTRSDTTVETLDSVLRVDVFESVKDRQLGRPVRVVSGFGHRLHLKINPEISLSTLFRVLR